MNGKLGSALSSGPLTEPASDLDLRLAVGQEAAIPCLLAPVTVRGRAVLLLYVDRDGRQFSDEDLSRAQCTACRTETGDRRADTPGCHRQIMTWA